MSKKHRQQFNTNQQGDNMSKPESNANSEAITQEEATTNGVQEVQEDKTSSELNPNTLPVEPVPEPKVTKQQPNTLRPTVVIEQVVTKATPKATKVPTVSATPAAELSEELIKFERILAAYKLAINTASDSTGRAITANRFYSIVEFVLKSKNNKVFDRCLAFFTVERNSIAHSDIALQGIQHITDKTKHSRISEFFAVFAALVRSKIERVPFRLSVPAIRVSLQNDPLCNWLISQR